MDERIARNGLEYMSFLTMLVEGRRMTQEHKDMLDCIVWPVMVSWMNIDG